MGISCADSEKADKKRSNRRFRRAIKLQINTNIDEELFFVLRELSDSWIFAKDAKKWYGKRMKKEWYRK